jgi:hypothetical protein
MIHLAERLDDILADLRGRAGSVEILPVAPRSWQAGNPRVWSGRERLIADHSRFLSPLVLHEGEKHLQDGDDYSPSARSVLRNGAALPIN